MLSFIFRTNALGALKVWHRAAAPPQGCWISALVRAPDVGGGSPPRRWASSGRSQETGLTRTPAAPALTRTEFLQRTQTAAGLMTRSKGFHSSAVMLKKRVKPEPPPRELDLLRYDMKELGKAPTPALLLGAAGLLPFVFPPLLMGMTENFLPELAYAQVAYGASILSFLGGARWGFALPESSPAKLDWVNLANSGVPAVLAWVAMLMSDSVSPAAMMVIVGLGVSLHYDLALLPTYPSWFKALRAVLTFVAFFSLLGTIVLDGLFPEKLLFTR